MNIDYLLWAAASAEQNTTHQIHFPFYEITKQKFFSKTILRMRRECILIIAPSKIGKTRLTMEIDQHLIFLLADSCLIRRPQGSLTFRKRGERGAFAKRCELSNADEAVPHINSNSESEKEPFEIIECANLRKMDILESNKL